jgi:hypothetical protein
VCASLVAFCLLALSFFLSHFFFFDVIAVVARSLREACCGGVKKEGGVRMDRLYVLEFLL